MKCQDEFEFSLDVRENIAALCPNCHKKIHLATDDEKKGMIEVLYKKKKYGIEARGLNITLKKLIKLH